MLLSTDVSNHYELLRLIGHTYYGGADANEVLQVAAAVVPGDDEGWYREFDALARRVRSAGDASLMRGHKRSAAKSYLRASMYFFMADFYLHGDPDDARILESSRASRACFMAASSDLDYSIKRVEIPYENTTLPAYLIKRKDSIGRRPTLICHSGFDGTKEEVAIWPGMAAAERGYTVIVFEGPGQGEVVREQRLTFRPNWEAVVQPIVDFAIARDDVDVSRIALMGISLGGVLAPIAAAHEPRLRALIANGGLYTLHDLIRSLYPKELPGDEKELATTMDELAKSNTSLRWLLNHGKYVFDYKGHHDFLEITKSYEAVDADKITCTTLVLDADLEGFFEGQPKKLFDKLNCPKTLLKLTIEEAAGAHCQAGAEGVGGQRIFDWLDETMQIV
jgi:pimeloyl-ACP methyl ester carboxylesterase